MSKSQKILKSQNMLYMLLIAGFMCLSGLFVYLFFDSSSPNEFLPSSSVDLPSDKVSAQAMWMSRMESEKQLTDARIQHLESLIMESKKSEAESQKENLHLRNSINTLKTELELTKQTKQRETDPIFVAEMDPIITTPVICAPPMLAELVMDEKKDKVQFIDEVIPSGTSVRALLVSSVDAPCSVYSNSDPQPVKLRILDDGHLPKGVRAKLKGGIIIASVYGELSSERVYMRLERLTQVKRGGSFIETDVTGYVTGEDGKYGVRGVVVDKSAKLIENAALSGFFSGVSQYFQTTIKARTCYGGCDYPCTTPVYNYGTDAAAQGGVYGATSAFDQLTDYYIKRAEQIRPVIQVSAGRIVDITFTHSAELGDLYTKDKVRQIRKQSQGEG